MRGMTFREGQASALRWLATVSRPTKTPSGMRPIVLVTRLRCTVAPLSKEDTLRDAAEGATHTLATAYTTPKLQPGDIVTSLLVVGGEDLIRPGKPWSIVGRRRYASSDDTDHQLLFVKEPL